MPANKKHLSSPLQRFLKISAAILGGYFVTVLFHNALGTIFNNKAGLIITSAYSSFLLWILLMVVAFMAKSGWKIWGIYLSLSFLFYFIIHFNK